MSQIIKESIDSVLQNQQYVPVKVQNWTSATVENCMKRLAALSKPFKVSAFRPPSPQRTRKLSLCHPSYPPSHRDLRARSPLFHTCVLVPSALS